MNFFGEDLDFDPPKNDPFSQGFSNFGDSDFDIARIEGNDFFLEESPTQK